MHPIKDIKNTFKITLPARKPAVPMKTQKEIKRYAVKSGIGKFLGTVAEGLIGMWG